MNAMDPLTVNALRLPGKTAIRTDAGEAMTYAEVHEVTDRLAAGLRELGLGDGDPVATFIPTSITCVVAPVAIMKAGLIYVGINVLFTSHEAGAILTDSGAKAVIVHESLLGVIEEARATAPELEHVIVVGSASGSGPSWDELAERPAAGPQTRTLNPSQPAAYFYTSGTTGNPKGAVHDHANIDGVVRKARIVSGLGEHDRVLAITPVFIPTGWVTSGWAPLAVGGEIFLMERFEPARCVDWIAEERLSFAWSIASALQRMNELPYDRDLSCMSRNLFGGATVPPSVRVEFEERFNCPIHHGYGSSEAIGTVVCHPLGDDEMRRAKVATVGLPIDGIEAAILDDDGQPLPVGEAGELCLRDDGRGTWKPLLRYHGRPDETAKTLSGGWLHTNDLAFRDEDGWITVHGRRGDLIKVSGWSVFASEIENVIDADERVRDVAVAGVPDERTGQKPVAFVTARPGASLTPEDVAELVDRKLSKVKRLREAVVLEELPVNAYGKVLKHRLVAAYEEERVAPPTSSSSS